MTILKTRAAAPSLFSSEPNQQKGGLFYRWHKRRERIRELNKLLSLEPRLLVDAGLSRDQIQAELVALQHKPI
jgi:uncharacterized protein YjiS (DUF1127 family)